MSSEIKIKKQSTVWDWFWLAVAVFFTALITTNLLTGRSETPWIDGIFLLIWIGICIMHLTGLTEKQKYNDWAKNISEEEMQILEKFKDVSREYESKLAEIRAEGRALRLKEKQK